MVLLGRLALSVVVAVVTLACMLLGHVLALIALNIVTVIAQFLEQWASVLGIVAGIWYFFVGYTRFTVN